MAASPTPQVHYHRSEVPFYACRLPFVSTPPPTAPAQCNLVDHLHAVRLEALGIRTWIPGPCPTSHRWPLDIGCNPQSLSPGRTHGSQKPTASLGRDGGSRGFYSFSLQRGRVSLPPSTPSAPASCPLSPNVTPPSSLLGIPQSYCFNKLLAL